MKCGGRKDNKSKLYYKYCNNKKKLKMPRGTVGWRKRGKKPPPQPFRPHPGERPNRLDSEGHLMEREEQIEKWRRQGICPLCGITRTHKKHFGVMMKPLVRFFLWIFLYINFVCMICILSHLCSLAGFIGWWVPHDVYHIQALHVWFCSRIWHKVS